MNVLSVVVLMLVDRVDVFVMGDMGGMSKGDVNGGVDGLGSWMMGKEYKFIIMGERVVVGFVMVVMVFGVIGGSVFFIL